MRGVIDGCTEQLKYPACRPVQTSLVYTMPVMERRSCEYPMVLVVGHYCSL
jgi:hypothetical protein